MFTPPAELFGPTLRAALGSRRRLMVVLAASLFGFARLANAQVTTSVGAGTAAPSPNHSASFESVAALIDNPYIEDGLSFTRTNLTFSNNQCGYAGCGYAFAAWFSGNYMYGADRSGTNSGFFSMFAPSGESFNGLEFIVGTSPGCPFCNAGYTGPMDVVWTALLGGSAIQSGTFFANAGDVVGFSSPGGFDQLNFMDDSPYNNPAFDEVRAQTTGVTSTPEPASLVLTASGLVGMVGVVRMRRKRSAAA
jgi:hypothetical protein